MHAPETYVVQPHDTLYSIAWRHDLDYRDLAKWNNLDTNFSLAVGQQLSLKPTGSPGVVHTGPAALKSVPLPAPRVGAPVPLTDTPPTQLEPVQPAHEPTSVGAPARVDGVPWVWPTSHESAPRPVPGGGILLFGHLGQDVRAAAAGRVVYTGNGIRGYGNLVIIKHGDSLLSSYAHNRELLVHEGQDVNVGQVIAHMGMGPHQVVALYFEIRVKGKPTDPLRYLAGAH